MTSEIFLGRNNSRTRSAASPFQSHLQIFPTRNLPPAVYLEICREGSDFTWQKLKSTQLQSAKLLTLSPRLSRTDILMLFSFGNKILSLPCRYPFSLCSSTVTGIQFKMFKTKFLKRQCETTPHTSLQKQTSFDLFQKWSVPSLLLKS